MVAHTGPENSYEQQMLERMEIIYARETRERRIFLDDLNDYRKSEEKRLQKVLKKSIGPIWNQALSVAQRKSLDTLEFTIYQDLLEGRPVKTGKVIEHLGIIPRPNHVELMNCVFSGRDDPKQMLSQLFVLIYGHSIDGRRLSYDLNARLICSAILYLGLNDLIARLKQRFKATAIEGSEPKKPKVSKMKKLPKSPYLHPLKAACVCLRPEPKIIKPEPMPTLEQLEDLNNETYEELIIRPPVPPTPPPPPKKRLPRFYCDKIAGITPIDANPSHQSLIKPLTRTRSNKKIRNNSLYSSEVKKKYGMAANRKPKTRKRRRPVAPNTGLWNAQYQINGVFYIQNKTVFVLANVCILPAAGDLIHGGFKNISGENVNIHCGFRAHPPPPKPEPCDCLQRYKDEIFDYVKATKCTCGHYYDFYAEGTFPADDLRFYQKPTRHMPGRFNYANIFETDPKSILVTKEFKKIWNTDSVLHVDDGTEDKDKKDRKKLQKKLKRSSDTCLGSKPKPEDYLKCALRAMRRDNIAARLPDIHLVPELKEWMRNRIYGPFTSPEKKEILRKSNKFWQLLQTFAGRGYGHVSPKKDPRFGGYTNWAHKHDLCEKFNKFTDEYKLEMFKSQAKVTNYFWASMCQAQFPDKKFREIFFSYMFSRVEDILLLRPYNKKEAQERKVTLQNKRYCCLPAAVEAAV